MLTSDKDRWVLAILENAKSAVEKTYPNDKHLNNNLTEALTIVCFKVLKKEEIDQ